MKKTRRILVRTLGALAAVLLLTVAALYLFLPVERLRDLAVSRAEAALGREVSVGEASVSLRGGLGVRLADVAVHEPPGFPAGRVFAAEGVDLKLRLGPLLRKRLHADRLVIEAPTIDLVRLDSLRTNFEFAAADAGDRPAGRRGSALDVERFEVRGGALSYRDETTGFVLRIAGLALDWSLSGDGGGYVTRGETRADSLAVDGPQPVALGPLSLRHAARIDPDAGRVDLDEGAVEIAGLALTITGGGDAGAARFEIAGEGLALERLAALIPAEQAPGLEGAEFAGAVDLAVAVVRDTTRAAPLDWTGTVALRGGRLVLPDLPDLPEPVTGLELAAAFGRDTLRVTRAAARVGGAELQATATVSGLAVPADARLDGEVSARVDLGAFADRLPPERAAALAGRADAALRLAGRLDAPRDLLAGGRIELVDLTYRDAHIFEPLTDLDATLSLDRRDLRVERCRATFDPSRGELTGVARGLVTALRDSTAPPPRLEFRLDAAHLDVDHLFPAAAPAAADPARPPVLAEFPDVTGGGDVSVARLIYGGVPFTGLTGRVTIADRKVTVSEARGAVYGGTVTGRTTVDLNDMNDPGYEGAFTAAAVRADSLLSRFTPVKGHLFGALAFDGAYTARGRDPVVFKRTLAMDARGAVSEGRLVTTGAVRRGLSALAGKLGRPFAGEERLRDLAGTVKTANERVIFEGLGAEVSGLGGLTLSGSYGFAGDLDFRGELLLTEAHSRKLLESGGGGLLDRLRGALGQPARETPRLKLPVSIGGAFGRPDVRIDFAALGRQAGQDVADGLRDRLGDLFR